jgi:hypothetical protein
MLDVFYKPNALIWLGQAFLPLAFLIPSVNTALLFTIVAAQAATIVLVYRLLRRAGLTTSDHRVPEASSHTCDK